MNSWWKLWVCVLWGCLAQLSIRGQVQTSQNVVYGEVNFLKNHLPPKVFRVFIDRNGHLYPNWEIPDAELRAAGASLKKWSLQFPVAFHNILDAYHIDTLNGSDDVLFDKLQHHIAQDYRQLIERSLGKNGTLNVLIHGFRKAVQPGKSPRTSEDDLYALRTALTPSESPNDYYLEVYWDGTFDCCFGTNLKDNARLFTLFEEEARRNAVLAGFGLRRVVSELQISQLNVITHSLGARVAMSLLFNAYPNFSDYNDAYPTPSQPVVKVLLIAPAIDGNEEFAYYFDRCSDTLLKQPDNYHILVIYNRKDFVLRKKDPFLYVFGPGARGKGSTRLGCNRKRIVHKVKRKLTAQGASNTFYALDFRGVGRCHLVKCYVAHPLFHEALEFLN